ncbi:MULTISPECIES: hypothetical protein [Pseudomonas]|uniref:MafI family immunity protein n=1 Tax=Pseudomonas fluorescens TaxID=294 RepID=A0A5E6YID8_PSEFL|nr:MULTISPECIES: hypothetical protein [Pseudomonas]PAA39437.1 hypothetical protein CJU75_02140 [Pseudomonas fragi]VVN53772.1 hypothetical protein PS685_01337 [Pseudomonas fluorescens]
MSCILTNAQWQLLVTLCFLRGEAQLALAEKLLHGSLAPSEIDELCELISNEFLMSGIEESFEPNSYGLELELLLDAVNRGSSADVDGL